MYSDCCALFDVAILTNLGTAAVAGSSAKALTLRWSELDEPTRSTRSTNLASRRGAPT